jgi:hypothetical protein
MRVDPLSTYNSLQKSLRWLDRYEPQCAAQIRRHEDKIQDFLAIRQYAVECRQVFSHRRWGITGEAGFFLDPFYSPGSDFIALGNTLLADLVRRDLSGKSIQIRARAYDRIFKAFYYGTAEVYQDQYPLFGNHQVMSVKIFWDWMVYWMLTAPVFMQNQLCNLNMYARNAYRLRRLRRLNHTMQQFFRTWHDLGGAVEVDAAIDVFDLDLISQMNERLGENLHGRDFDRRFAENIDQLETVFWEIVDRANLDVPIPLKRTQHRRSRKNTLQLVFDRTAASRHDDTNRHPDVSHQADEPALRHR